MFEKVLKLQILLSPQQELMKVMLHQTSGHWDLSQMQAQLTSGEREYRFALLHCGTALLAFFKHTWQNWIARSHWQSLPSTERFYAEVLKLSHRAAAVVYQLIAVRTRICPYRVFALLLHHGEQRLEFAESIWASPACLRDNWSAAFLERYSTPRDLVSEEALNTLSVIGKHARMPGPQHSAPNGCIPKTFAAER